MRRFVRVYVAAAMAGLGCQGEPAGPEPHPIPPPGPHFTQPPIPVTTVARITPIGFNNEPFPTAHTYWETCDGFVVLRSTRPCHREFQPLVAPGSGVVRHLEAVADGTVSVEGPPGLLWTFGHVTPAPGLGVGSVITAGQVIATMFLDHGFDFGLINYGVEHTFIVPERYPDGYRYGQNPIAQFPDPLRTELLTRVNSLSDPMGRLSFDIAITASGGWFIGGAPKLWLARYVERVETRIVGVADAWAGWWWGFLAAVDPGAPDWEAITPASGAVAVRLWTLGPDALPNPAQPAGTLLVELTGPATLRIDWFDTHDPVSAFTGAARTYER